MATTSSRSFNQYSGIDRQRQMQGLPSALERMQDPAKYGAGTAADSLLKSKYSWSLPLSERPATPVGRSWYNPERQAERVVRGTARPGQLQGAMIHENLQEPLDQFEQILQDQANQNFDDTTNYGNPQNRGPIRGYLGALSSQFGRNSVNNAMSRSRSFF